MQPATSHTHKLFYFFNFQPEGQRRNKHNAVRVSYKVRLRGFVVTCSHGLFQSCKNAATSVFMFNPHTCPSSGAQHSSGHGLRRGSSPLGRLPRAPAALWSLETCVEHPGHQHGRVSAPQAGPLQKGLHSQQHHGEETTLLNTAQLSGVWQRSASTYTCKCAHPHANSSLSVYLRSCSCTYVKSI